MQNQHKIILIGIPEVQHETLNPILEKHALEYIHTKNSQSAITLLQKNDYSAILLALNLQDIYGIEFCKNLKRQYPNLPVIFVSESLDPTEIVLCFEAGADDYIEVPFHPYVFIAKLKARLKKKTQQPIDPSLHEPIININDYYMIDFGKWSYQPKKSMVIYDKNSEIYLTDRENTLLKLLLSNPRKTFSRTDIAKHIFLQKSSSINRDVNIHIHRLRNKLTEGHNASSPIKSIRAKGYTLDNYLSYQYDGKRLF